MFDNYADYMYSLLTAPLKQVKKASNQFYLFFKVVGALYDQTVQDIQKTPGKNHGGNGQRDHAYRARAGSEYAPSGE